MKLQQTTQSLNSSMKIYVSYIFRKFIILKFFCILDTTNMVKTCDYLRLNNEIHFTKQLKMSDPCAGRNIIYLKVWTINIIISVLNIYKQPTTNNFILIFQVWINYTIPNIIIIL